MKIKMTKSAYEAPRTEVVLMDKNASVFMASTTPSRNYDGSGFEFGTGNGSWG